MAGELHGRRALSFISDSEGTSPVVAVEVKAFDISDLVVELGASGVVIQGAGTEHCDDR